MPTSLNEVWLTVNPLSNHPREIGGENPFDISVFPIPFENEFNVKFILKTTMKVSWFLTNSSGQILIKSETKFFNETDNTINVKIENENSAKLLLFNMIFDDKYSVTKKLMRNKKSIRGLAFAFQVAAQQQSNTKEYYLEKSKRNKTTGFILAGAGLAMIGVGALTWKNNGILSENDAFTTATVLIIAGAGTSLASIPLFISSGNNARKAATISLDRKQIEIPGQKYHTPHTAYPALALRFSF